MHQAAPLKSVVGQQEMTMRLFRLLIVTAVVSSVALGCTEVKSPPPAKVVFITGTKQVELALDKKVQLGSTDIIGKGIGGGIGATAQLLDKAILIETESDVGGKHTVSTRTVRLDRLPVDLVEPWGVGKICIKDARPAPRTDW